MNVAMSLRAITLTTSNAALYLATCALFGTGLLLELRMDEEDGARRLFGMGADDWGEVHIIVALTFVSLAILHLVLNWAWIKAALAKARLAYGVLVAGFGLIAVLLLWPAETSWFRELFD
jgi:hypothetical protein